MEATSSDALTPCDIKAQPKVICKGELEECRTRGRRIFAAVKQPRSFHRKNFNKPQLLHLFKKKVVEATIASFFLAKITLSHVPLGLAEGIDSQHPFSGPYH